MNIVKHPLNRSLDRSLNNPLDHSDADLPKSANRFVYIMQAGQLVMALTLAGFGAARAVNTGVSFWWAVIPALVLIWWQVFGIFFKRVTKSRFATLLWLGEFFGIWLLTVFISAEFVWLAFLLWLLAGHLLKLSHGIWFSVLVFAVVALAPVYHHGETNYANIFGPLIGGVFAFGISRGYLQLLQDTVERETLLKNLTKAHEETAELQIELARSHRHSGAVAERTRIARDIHDTVAQSLSSIRLLTHAQIKELEQLQQSVQHQHLQQSQQPQHLQHSQQSKQLPTGFDLNSLRQVEEIAGESLTDVRRIIAALTPAELENSSLSSALNHLVTKLQQETGIKTRVHFDQIQNLGDETELALLRTAQSALANVRKHAAAEQVSVTLSDSINQVRLDIIDDGVGFDSSEWAKKSATTESGYGLRFMRERLQELGGDIDVDSRPKYGTAVSIFLPKTVAS